MSEPSNPHSDSQGRAEKPMSLDDFQQLISRMYEQRDRQRGTPATFLWFIEEVGELATALAGDDQRAKEEEFADVFAWLCTLANINDVRLSHAVRKYMQGHLGYK